MFSIVLEPVCYHFAEGSIIQLTLTGEDADNFVLDLDENNGPATNLVIHYENCNDDFFIKNLENSVMMQFSSLELPIRQDPASKEDVLLL
mmetsp:Transcript_38434/g.63294  ORF Transcript_38434/g.63294 Transcript_38434/m.63294 type:complete len:90 (-) Transcript_38434:226-495(-)